MNKLAVFLLAGVMVVWSVINVLTGILGLTNTKKSPLAADVTKDSVCEFKVQGASEAMHIKHKFKNILPLGTEHFYLVIVDKNVSPLLVRASKSWYSRNFDSSGVAKKELTVKGEVCSYKGASSLKVLEINLELKLNGMDTLSTDYYIDLQYIPRSIVKLLSGVLMLASGAMLMFFFQRFGGDASYTPAKLAYIGSGVVGLAGLIMFIMSITVLR